ncbi:porin [Paraburkholderia sp. MM5477-R1]|uniref:porin n=1 Tax=Paraburkholderia sp. MM5477-R1 TaxID=2991062 RepID=UPI003D1B55B3
MKKTCLAAFVLAGAAAPGAYAQSSVTLYGIVDSGILYKTHVGAGGSAWALGTGIDSTNRWGLTGREDLGGGLHATFELESGFRISTGASINGGLPASSGTVLFDRGATVGLSSDVAGGILLGKNRSPLLRILARIDIEGYSNFGSLNNLLYQNLSGYTGYQYSWVDNSVEYMSPEIAGFQGSAMYAFGGVAGDTRTKRVISLGGSYRTGSFLAGAAYFTGRDVTGATDATTARAYTVGANYAWSQFEFMLDFSNFKNPTRNTSDNFYTAEIAYSPTSFWIVTATYIRQDDRVTNDRDASLYKLGASYLLSRATSLYSFIGYVKNNRLATLGLQNSTPAGVVGANQFGFAAGIRHTF